MIKESIFGTGVSGLKVEFNHSELVALKQMQQNMKISAERCAEISDQISSGQKLELSKSDCEKLDAASTDCEAMRQFLVNVLPTDIMSVDDAWNELFSDNSVNHKPQQNKE